MNYKEIASNVVDAVKDYIELQMKREPNNNTYDGCIRYYRVVRGKQDGYRINVNNKDITDILESFEFKSVIDELLSQLKELKNDSKWSGIDWILIETHLPNSLSVIKVPYVKFFTEPCKEFTKLRKFLEKHCGKIISKKDLYKVYIGGKRGRIYCEDGERDYLAYHPTKCAQILTELRSAKGTRDIARTTDIKTIDDIDDFELQVSIRHETEFDGMRYTECVVIVETPSGKTKKTIRVGM